MAARKTGLGRGLEALIPMERPKQGFAQIPLERITPNPNQPRTSFADDALAELTASIREVGVLQPVVVHPDVEDGRYVLIAGERRWRAAQMAGLGDLPAMIRDDADSAHSLTEALIENLQREDLSSLEEGRGLYAAHGRFCHHARTDRTEGWSEPECGQQHTAPPAIAASDPGNVGTR